MSQSRQRDLSGDDTLGSHTPRIEQNRAPPDVLHPALLEFYRELHSVKPETLNPPQSSLLPIPPPPTPTDRRLGKSKSADNLRAQTNPSTLLPIRDRGTGLQGRDPLISTQLRSRSPQPDYSSMNSSLLAPRPVARSASADLLNRSVGPESTSFFNSGSTDSDGQNRTGSASRGLRRKPRVQKRNMATDSSRDTREQGGSFVTPPLPKPRHQASSPSHQQSSQEGSQRQAREKSRPDQDNILDQFPVPPLGLKKKT